ncbi:MAG: DUF2269 family protein [Gammaproteobacteria bacterium]|nr:DUF2269 domain-containing protein [Gammaproteobacteria bacterium]NNC97470.1 DUF2269 family protein [Gammaproteobacteria bacterium]NNM14884.1 DUF2269 family protein [Gammaproteobacteria bacterium]
MDYLSWKTIHIASVIIFIGNITTGLFWAAHAKKSRDFKIIASTFSGISKSDRWFTLPGVFGILISGVALALAAKFPILSTGWIFWALMLFAVSGIVFSIWIAPLQKQISQYCETQNSDEKSWNHFTSLYKKWEIYGLIALFSPAIAFVLMVLKPGIPGL